MRESGPTGIERVEEGLGERKGGGGAPQTEGRWGLRDHRKSHYARKRKGEAKVLGKAQAPKQPLREGHEGCWQGKGRPPRFSTLRSSKKKEIQYSR